MSDPFWKQLGFESEQDQRDYEIKLLGLLGDASTPRPARPVSDAMVARAVRSFWGHIPDMQPRDVWPYRMRRALTAALSGE